MRYTWWDVCSARVGDSVTSISKTSTLSRMNHRKYLKKNKNERRLLNSGVYVCLFRGLFSCIAGRQELGIRPGLHTLDSWKSMLISRYNAIFSFQFVHMLSGFPYFPHTQTNKKLSWIIWKICICKKMQNRKPSQMSINLPMKHYIPHLSKI